jgi:hypothetical protein
MAFKSMPRIAHRLSIIIIKALNYRGPVWRYQIKKPVFIPLIKRQAEAPQILKDPSGIFLQRITG